MAMHRNYRVTDAHRAILGRVGAISAYRIIVEGRKAPINYSWYMFSRMIRSGQAHKFELALIESLEVIDAHV